MLETVGRVADGLVCNGMLMCSVHDDEELARGDLVTKR
jgi:hypothetical protein